MGWEQVEWQSDGKAGSVSLTWSQLLGLLWMVHRESLRLSLSLSSWLHAHWTVLVGLSGWQVWAPPMGSTGSQAGLSKRAPGGDSRGAEPWQGGRDSCLSSSYHTHTNLSANPVPSTFETSRTWQFLTTSTASTLVQVTTISCHTYGSHLLNKVSRFTSLLCSKPSLIPYFTQSPNQHLHGPVGPARPGPSSSPALISHWASCPLPSGPLFLLSMDVPGLFSLASSQLAPAHSQGLSAGSSLNWAGVSTLLKITSLLALSPPPLPLVFTAPIPACQAIHCKPLFLILFLFSLGSKLREGTFLPLCSLWYPQQQEDCLALSRGSINSYWVDSCPSGGWTS